MELTLKHPIVFGKNNEKTLAVFPDLNTLKLTGEDFLNILGIIRDKEAVNDSDIEMAAKVVQQIIAPKLGISNIFKRLDIRDTKAVLTFTSISLAKILQEDEDDEKIPSTNGGDIVIESGKRT